jgi:hypothetical protein
MRDVPRLRTNDPEFGNSHLAAAVKPGAVLAVDQKVGLDNLHEVGL